MAGQTAAEKAAEKAEADRVEAERLAAEKAEADRVEAAAGSVEVVMLIAISGTRNGEKWPGAGDSISLPEAEAAEYIANGYAKPVE